MILFSLICVRRRCCAIPFSNLRRFIFSWTVVEHDWLHCFGQVKVCSIKDSKLWLIEQQSMQQGEFEWKTEYRQPMYQASQWMCFRSSFSFFSFSNLNYMDNLSFPKKFVLYVAAIHNLWSTCLERLISQQTRVLSDLNIDKLNYWVHIKHVTITNWERFFPLVNPVQISKGPCWCFQMLACRVDV